MKIPKLNFKKEEYIKIGKYIFLFVLAFFLFWGIKTVLGGYFAWQYSKDMYFNMAAQMPVDYSFLKPFRNWEIDDLELNVSSVISVEINGNSKKVLFGKDIDKQLPIASLSKLFSSYLFVENYDLNKEIKVSQRAVQTEENVGLFSPGEKFIVKELLHSVLMESSNDATYALAEVAGIDEFVELMNEKAKELGLRNSRFTDPIGLDPDYTGQRYNISTANDLAEFVDFLIKESKKDSRIAFLVESTQKSEYDLYRSDKNFHHKIENTNKILENNHIILGKTGRTPLAKECLVLVIQHPKYENAYIVNVILGSNDRFEDMETLINWIKKAYIW